MVQLPDNATGFLKLPDIIGDRRKGISGLYPVSRSAWYEGVRTNVFPKPVKLGPGPRSRTVAWRASDIQALIASTSVQTADDGAK